MGMDQMRANSPQYGEHPPQGDQNPQGGDAPGHSHRVDHHAFTLAEPRVPFRERNTAWTSIPLSFMYQPCVDIMLYTDFDLFVL